MSEFEMQLAAEKNNSTADAEFEATTKCIAVGRMAQPSEIAACCLFLASGRGVVRDRSGAGRRWRWPRAGPKSRRVTR
jgi:hypothetical protein